MAFVFLNFFFNDTATTEIYTLSLHDALPIYLVENRLGKFEPTPDGHKEGRFHVTLPLRATTTPWAGWRYRGLSLCGLFVCFAHVRSAPKRKGAIAFSRLVRRANRLRLQLTGL